MALCLLLVVAMVFLPSARAQQNAVSRKVDIGIIVTRTAGDAESVLKELKAGTDFGVLAKEKSIEPSSDDGGYLGRLSLTELRPEFRAALNGIEAGEFTGIVHAPSGFAILTIFASAPDTQDLNAERIYSLTKSGVIRETLDLSGMREADSSFQQYAKPEGWQYDLPQACAIRGQSYLAGVNGVTHLLAEKERQTPSTAVSLDTLRAHIALAQLYVYGGDLQKSIDEWMAAYRIAHAGFPSAEPYLEEALGVSYLHVAEVENDVYRDGGSMDIFPPLNPAAHYQKQDNSQRAVEYFLHSLEEKPDNLEAKWLLNLAYMTLGQYPAGVPAKYLIPQRVFESNESVGRFSDVALPAGLKELSGAGGAIVEDFENNGRLDIVTSSIDMCEPLHYFHNNGDGTFSDRTVQAGLSNQFGGIDVIDADYNNDGCMDLFVVRGGWEFGMRKSLLRNNCDGTFTDVTKESGLDGIPTQTESAAWADIDNDGYLDLFIANEHSPSQLFRNRGDGTFEDISHAAGIDKNAFSKAVAAGDYDNDGYVDFYESNQGGSNFLFHNNHNNTFTDVAKQAGVQAPYFSFATWFSDYDNDGWPDLFVTSYFTSSSEVIRSYLDLPNNVETLKLYRNLHNGTFQDVTKQVGLDRVFMPMGANFGDIDNDGFLDIYLGNGDPSLASLMPHTLLRNNEGKSFADVTASSGTGELHNGHGISFADVERSGYEDIVSETGGLVPTNKHTLRLFHNPGNGNDWINIRLVGVKSNRAAIGARIKVTVENEGRGCRSIYRTVGDTSSFGGNPMEQHIGLGHDARITGIDVWWPATNTRQHFSPVGKNQFIEVKEFANTYTKLNRQPVLLGANKSLAAAR